MAVPAMGKSLGLILLFLTFYTGCAFRIRDGNQASSERTPPACNPLFGKCTDKTPVSSPSPTAYLRTKYDGVPASQRNTKIQQPVEPDSDEEPDLSHVKKSPLRPEKVLNVRISDHMKLQFKTTTGLKSASRAGLRLKVSRVEDEDDNGDEDNEEGDDEENEIESDDEVGSDEVEEESEENESDDDEGKVSEESDENEKTEDDRSGFGSTSQADEDENSDSEDDDEDDDEKHEQERIDDEKMEKVYGDALKGVTESNKESAKVTLTRKSTDATRNIEKSKVIVKQESLRGLKVESKELKEKEKSHAEEVIVEEPEDDVLSKDEQFEVHVVDNLQSSAIRKDESGDRDAGADDSGTEADKTDDTPQSDSDDEGTNSDVVPKPSSRPLEKVRLADKPISVGSSRSGSVEVNSEKVATKISMDNTIVSKKVETAKPSKSSVEQAKPKLLPKSEEKIKTSVEPEVKKELPKPQTKSKEQSKKTEKPKVKEPEVKSAAKSQPEELDRTVTKPKPKTKKWTEASITLPELNDLILHLPTFTPNFSAIEDPVCQQHGKIFLRQLRGYKLWALQMLDSNAKIPSGLLRGNVNQLGDFDQCLGITARVKVDEKTVKVQGKYCLATIDLHATRPEMKVPVNLMQSRAFIRGNMRDPGHFIPRFTTVNWALCFPAACSAEDAQTVIGEALRPYNMSAGLKFTVDVDPDMCYVRQKSQSFSKETVGVLYFYAMILCLGLVATLRDFCVTPEGKGTYSERIIMAFSFRRTTTALFIEEQHSSDIRCIHGIRSLATIALYVAHKLIPISRIPFANRATLTEAANNPLSSVLRVSVVYTDAFLLLSGVLAAYNMAKELTVRGEVRWFCRFITRFIRLTPALLAVVFWYAFVMEHAGNGPQWNNVVRKNAELCKRNSWTNLLYIQNFFPFEEMCATHTHQLALDMQLSLIAPMLVFFLHCKPIVGILLTFFLLQVSATVRYLSTTNNYLSLVIFHGISLKHLYKTANLTYALPLHRATPYLLGVALGVLLRYVGRNVRVHKVFVVLGWLVAIALASWSFFSPWKLARRDYIYDVEEATHYAVLSPVAWGIALCWVIFACFTGHGGIINRILSNYWLLVFSRLSYAVYLTQFAVFFYNVGVTRYTSEFQVHRAVDLFEAATVIAVSVFVTLLFDLPMQEVKNVIMESTDGLVLDVSGNDQEEEDNEDEEHSQGQKDEGNTDVKSFAEDEVESTGWDWQKDIVNGGQLLNQETDTEEPTEVWNYKNDESRRKSFIRHEEAGNEEIPTWDWIKGPRKRIPRTEDQVLESSRRSRSTQRPSLQDYDDEPSNQQQDQDVFRREKRSQSRTSDNKRSSVKDTAEPSWEFTKRERSSSRAADSKRPSVKEPEEMSSRDFVRRERSESKGRIPVREQEEPPSWEFVKRERSASRGADSKRSSVIAAEEQKTPTGLARGSLARSSEPKVILSSESEDETIWQRQSGRHGKPETEEPRVSDEEGWEYELRLRRQKLAESLTSQETGTGSEEEDWSSLRRRSSAEGKIALLNDSPEVESIGTWSISKVPKVSRLGSSQEPSEGEEDNAFVLTRKAYRETRPPFREREGTQSEDEISWNASRRRSYTSCSQPTSLEDEDDGSSYDFSLRKENKRMSLQNLSSFSQDEPGQDEDSGWDFVKEDRSEPSTRTTTAGLFKRASIVKSQASEEDPEYLLPERPKLVEQEQEHPFKKAWQMQKSRSEEDGPSGFSVKDSKPRSGGSGNRKDVSEKEASTSDKRRPSGGQAADDMNYFGSDEEESTSISRADSPGEDVNLDCGEEEQLMSSKSETDEDNPRFEWPGEEEQFATFKQGQRRRSEEANWEWGQEET